MSRAPAVYREWCLWMSKVRDERGDADGARVFEQRAGEQPIEQLVMWPDGMDRGAAEAIALGEFPTMPVAGAPNGYLLGIVEQRAKNAARTDAAPIAAIPERFDAAREVEVNELDRVEARAGLALAGLTEEQANPYIDAMARRTAWNRGTNNFVGRVVPAAVAARGDIEPTSADLKRARQDLAHRRPLDGSKQVGNVFRAAELESAIVDRARQHARRRVEGEIESAVRAEIGPAPTVPPLPKGSLRRRSN